MNWPEATLYSVRWLAIAYMVAAFLKAIATTKPQPPQKPAQTDPNLN